MQRLSSVVKEKVEAYVVSGVQEERKIELLDNLSVAVEKVQSKFENPIHNKVVKEGKEVENLCSCLEDIFQHGLREKGLSIVQTDVNRCRAWIRMKLKDHTIGSYIGLLTENSKLLKEHYNTNAFLRDAVKTESVRTLLQYVIASLDFYISIESSDRYADRKPSLDRSYSSASPDIDVRQEAFQSGEIIKSRRSSKRKARAPIVNIAPMKEFDTMSHASSDRSSDYSSRSSSVISPLSPRCESAGFAVKKADTGVDVKFLEGHLLKAEAKLNATDSAGLGIRAECAFDRSRSVNSSLSVDGLGRRGEFKARSNSSGSSRSRSSLESQRDSTFDSSLSQEIASSYKGKSDESFKWPGVAAEGKINGAEDYTKLQADTSSTPRKYVLTEQQKGELVEMMRSLRFNSNRPLTTEKVLEMIPVQNNMSREEIKNYIDECLRDYFSMGIITTMQKSPLKKPIKTETNIEVAVDPRVDGTCKESNKDKIPNNKLDLDEINKTKSQSLDNFLSEGRATVPLWSSMNTEISKHKHGKSSDLEKEAYFNDREPVVQNKIERDSISKFDDGVDREDNFPKDKIETSVNTDSFQAASQLFEGNSVKNNVKSDALIRCLSSDTEIPVDKSNPRIDYSDIDEVKKRGTAGNELHRVDHVSAEDVLIDINSTSGLPVTQELENARTPVLLEKKSFASETSAFEKPSRTVDRTKPSVVNEVAINDALIDDLDDSIGLVNGNDNPFFEKGNEYAEKSFEPDLSIDADEPNFVPGIHDDPLAHTFSQAKPITRSRKANTIGNSNNRQSTPKSAKGPTSLDRETPGKLKIKVPSSTEASDLLYGFRVKSPTFDSTKSSIDTSQGFLFDNDDYITDSDADTFTTGDNSERDRIRSLLADLGVNDDIIGMKEDHFATPDSFMGFTNDEELENAIETCKERIKSLPPDSEERKHLVIKLVQLRLKKHELKEAPSENPMHVKKILGHHFAKQGKSPGNYFCDSCGATIWALLHTLYKCQDCSFHCHRKCLKSVDKPCVSSKVSGSVYITDITPECGLATQQYRCADCRRRLIFRDGCFQARLCDYTGQFYCSNCHWNETQVIPARVIHNWDFVPRKISRQSKHLLNLLSFKPIICLKKMNPALFNFVEDLRDVRALREQTLSMKKYLVSCRIAVEERLLLMICQGRGFICEICPSTDVIFPFDFNSLSCPECMSLFHRSVVELIDDCQVKHILQATLASWQNTNKGFRQQAIMCILASMAVSFPAVLYIDTLLLHYSENKLITNGSVIQLFM
eukprot:gene1579-16031_t